MEALVTIGFLIVILIIMLGLLFDEQEPVYWYFTGISALSFFCCLTFLEIHYYA